MTCKSHRSSAAPLKAFGTSWATVDKCLSIRSILFLDGARLGAKHVDLVNHCFVPNDSLVYGRVFGVYNLPRNGK
jgi:hypothetical protein